jgi:hypothetical protein
MSGCDEILEDAMSEKDLVIFSWNGKPICDMSTSHIQNSVKLLERKKKETGKDYELALSAFAKELEIRNQIKGKSNE